jgi:hypothetical protein
VAAPPTLHDNFAPIEPLAPAADVSGDAAPLLAGKIDYTKWFFYYSFMEQ